jgi:hypothetical protein
MPLPHEMDNGEGDRTVAKRIVLDLDVVHGDAGLVQGQSFEMPNVLLLARSEEEFWEDAGLVLRGLFEMQGLHVQSTHVDRRNSRIVAEVT